MKELTDLYEQIGMIINNNSNLMRIKSENQCFYNNDIQRESYREMNKAETNLQISHKHLYLKGKQYFEFSMVLNFIKYLLNTDKNKV